MWVIYTLLVFLLAVLGFKLLSFLPNFLRWVIVGFGVGILLIPIYVPHVFDYYAPAWAPAFFEHLFTNEATNLGKLSLIRMLIGGGIGAGIGLVTSILLSRSDKDDEYEPLFDDSGDPLLSEVSEKDVSDALPSDA